MQVTRQAIRSAIQLAIVQRQSFMEGCDRVRITLCVLLQDLVKELSLRDWRIASVAFNHYPAPFAGIQKLDFRQWHLGAVRNRLKQSHVVMQHLFDEPGVEEI